MKRAKDVPVVAEPKVNSLTIELPELKRKTESPESLSPGKLVISALVKILTVPARSQRARNWVALDSSRTMTEAPAGIE